MWQNGNSIIKIARSYKTYYPFEKQWNLFGFTAPFNKVSNHLFISIYQTFLLIVHQKKIEKWTMKCAFDFDTFKRADNHPTHRHTHATKQTGHWTNKQRHTPCYFPLESTNSSKLSPTTSGSCWLRHTHTRTRLSFPSNMLSIMFSRTF